MDKQAVIRRVRIAVSVFFGVLTVALCVLWVRSYWRIDHIRAYGSTSPTIGYREGRLCLESEHNGRYPGWEAESVPVTIPESLATISFGLSRKFTIARIPFWLPIVLCCLRYRTMDTASRSPFLPPHHADRHDAGGRRAGAGSMGWRPRLSRLLHCPVGGMGMGPVFAILLLIATIIAAWLAVGPVLWAWWHFRRTVWRHKQFSLGGLFVSFTVVAILIWMAAALVRGAG